MFLAVRQKQPGLRSRQLSGWSIMDINFLLLFFALRTIIWSRARTTGQKLENCRYFSSFRGRWAILAPDWWDIADFVHFFQWTFLTECTGSKKNGMALVVDPPPSRPTLFPSAHPATLPVLPPASGRSCGPTEGGGTATQARGTRWLSEGPRPREAPPLRIPGPGPHTLIC